MLLDWNANSSEKTMNTATSKAYSYLWKLSCTWGLKRRRHTQKTKTFVNQTQHWLLTSTGFGIDVMQSRRSENEIWRPSKWLGNKSIWKRNLGKRNMFSGRSMLFQSNFAAPFQIQLLHSDAELVCVSQTRATTENTGGNVEENIGNPKGAE